MNNFRSSTVRAAGWVLGSRAISQAISFGFGIALARLLVPDDFGLLAMIVVFTGFAGLLSDAGFAASLIQKKDAREQHFSSVFWVNLLLGSTVGILLFFSSGLISQFYGRPELQDIIKVISISYPIAAFSTVPSAVLTKALDLKHLNLFELTGMVISGIVAIALAINGFGYWSLVFQRLTQQLVTTLLIWKTSHWRPQSGIDSASIKELFVFSGSVFLTKVLRHFMQNMDKILLGKFLGGETLGFYDRAQSMMLFPLRNVSSGIGKVMFPSLSIIQADKERVKNVYLRSISTIAFATYPMMAGMFVVSNSFVLGILGNHWADVIPIIKIFCIAGLMSSIVTVTGSLFLSQGAASLQLRTSLITIPIRIAGIIIGLQWGLLGVAIGFTTSLAITSYITLSIAYRLIDLRYITMIRFIAPVLTPSIVMAAVVWAIRPLLGLENELLLFLIQAVTGFFVYWGLVSLLKLRAYRDIAGILHEEFISRRKSS